MDKKQIFEEAKKLYNAYKREDWQQEKHYGDAEEKLTARDIWAACLKMAWSGLTVDKKFVFAYPQGIGFIFATGNESENARLASLATRAGKARLNLREKIASKSSYDPCPPTYTIALNYLEEIFSQIEKEIETKEAEKKSAENSALKGLGNEESLKFFVETIEVSDELTFSKNPAETAFSYQVWSKDTPEEVRATGKLVQVKGYGKFFSYRQVTKESKNLFLKKYETVIAEKVQSLLK